MNDDEKRELYDRFLKRGAGGLQDQEAIKLLLTALFPKEDVDRIATTLKTKFGGLRGMLDAPLRELEVIDAIGAVGAMSLRIVRETATLYLQETAERQDCLGNSEALERFWRFRIGALPYEVFQVAFLNSGYQLLREGIEQFARGIADRAIVYPRVVMEAALSKRAAAIVLAHNHTNGNVQPSEQDKALTRMIVLAGEALQVRVLDHLIVSADEVFSFRRAGLL
jgi:DNA repair protein RadC